jgi:hypothetical protein
MDDTLQPGLLYAYWVAPEKPKNETKSFFLKLLVSQPLKTDRKSMMEKFSETKPSISSSENRSMQADCLVLKPGENDVLLGRGGGKTVSISEEYISKLKLNQIIDENIIHNLQEQTITRETKNFDK